MGDTLVAEASIESDALRRIQIAVVINDQFGQTIVHSVDQDDRFEAQGTDGTFAVRVTFPDLRIYPGRYTFGSWCGWQSEDYDYIREAIDFTVEQGNVSNRTTKMVYGKAVCFAPTKWQDIDCRGLQHD